MLSYFRISVNDVLDTFQNIVLFTIGYGILSICPTLVSFETLFIWNLTCWIFFLFLFTTLEKKSLFPDSKMDGLIIATNTLLMTGLPYAFYTASIPELSIFQVLRDLMLFVLVEDLFFYLIHRSLHWGPLYQNIHYFHHRKKIVKPLYAQYSHPIETIINALSMALVIEIINASHLSLFIMSPIFICSNISSHSYPDKRHGIHHRLYNCNYGALELTDFIFRTNRKEMSIV